MEFKNLIIQKEDNICIVRINNPQSMNALNSDVLSELDAAFSSIDQDADIDAVILTAHDKFQEILNEAQKGNSIFNLFNSVL